jgi:hypothetical protein
LSEDQPTEDRAGGARVARFHRPGVTVTEATRIFG